jgi:hypothetical protein
MGGQVPDCPSRLEGIRALMGMCEAPIAKKAMAVVCPSDVEHGRNLMERKMPQRHAKSG